MLGALAGAMATTGAALATGWSQRESARIAARAEYQRQRHQSRHTAYKSFIASTQSLSYASRTFRRQEIPVDAFTDSVVETFASAESEIKEAWLEVVLSGPAEVSRRAAPLLHASNLLKNASFILNRMRTFQHALPVGEPTLEELIDTVREAAFTISRETGRFIEAAEEALSKDGSERG